MVKVRAIDFLKLVNLAGYDLFASGDDSVASKKAYAERKSTVVLVSLSKQVGGWNQGYK